MTFPLTLSNLGFIADQAYNKSFEGKEIFCQTLQANHIMGPLITSEGVLTVTATTAATLTCHAGTANTNLDICPTDTNVPAGIIVVTGGTGATTITLPTGLALVNCFKPSVGDVLNLKVIMSTAFTCGFAAQGAGSSVVGGTIAASSSGSVKIRFTNVSGATPTYIAYV